MTCSFKSSRVLLVAALVAFFFNGAFAHTYLSSVFSNGQALAEGDCVRPHPSTAYDFPIPLVTSPEMTCGWASGKNNERANRRCPVEAGSMFGLQWYHQRPGAQDQIVDPTHAGPLMVYLAKSDSGAGNVWFKIYEDGYTNGKWAVDKLIANRGRVDFRIPADIAPGNYLLRGEILAHHESYRINGVQPYVGCVEITISGNGNVNPTGVAFPGYYKNTDPGMLFDRYGGFTSYVIPGPAVYSSSSSSSSSGSNNNNNPTTAPSKPEATTRPTNAPSTSAPVANSIKIGLNGANQWYFGVVVNGGGETTVKVEMKDNGSVKNWVAMTDKSYAYAYSANPVLVLPVSIRLTSSSGKVVVFENIFNSFSGSVDTGKTYASSSNVPATTPKPTATSAPVTSAPVTSAPVTNAPTSKPTNAPAPTTPASTSGNNGNNGNNAKVTIYNSASDWWFALSVSGASDVAKVEIKDSGAVTSFKTMDANNWGGSSPVYTFSAQGTPLATPITIKITNKSGKSINTIINKISGNAVFNADGSL